MTAWIVFTLCTAMIATDILTRSVRLRIMMRGAGSPVVFRHALAITTFGDSLAIVTPWRIGGEAGRAMGARSAGIPLPVIAGVLSLELAVAYTVAAVVGTWLTAAFAGQWLETMDALSAFRASPVALVALLASAATVAALASHALGSRIPRFRAAIVDAIASVRLIPGPALAVVFALSAVALTSRLLVLPMLALTLNHPPATGVLLIVSFALLHGQIATPTPAGAGAVEAMFLTGAAGIPTEASAGMLGWWRLFSTAIPMIVGFVIGAITYGPSALNALAFLRPQRHPSRT